jgi:MFS transporter, DHA1 family, quinolone resistance protein
MATEIEFSFAALTSSARRHIRVFQIHQFLDRFAMGLTVAVVALALTDRGMDLFPDLSSLWGLLAHDNGDGAAFGGLPTALAASRSF